MEKNQKQMQTGHSVKSRNGQQEGTGQHEGTVLGGRNSAAGTNFAGALISLYFLLFFPSGL